VRAENIHALPDLNTTCYRLNTSRNWIHIYSSCISVKAHFFKTWQETLERFPAQIFRFCSYNYKQFTLNHKTRKHFRPFPVHSGFYPNSCFRHVLLHILTACERYDGYLIRYTLAKPEFHTREDNEWKFYQRSRNERTRWINPTVAEDSWIFKTFLSPCFI
jgi:hypothetical protein